MKYVMFQKQGNVMVIHTPIIFPDRLVHLDVANHMCGIPGSPLFGHRPVSAGFFSSLGLSANVYGESESLKLASNPRDAEFITMSDYGGGME